jgi:hypothetical protein
MKKTFALSLFVACLLVAFRYGIPIFRDHSLSRQSLPVVRLGRAVHRPSSGNILRLKKRAPRPVPPAGKAVLDDGPSVRRTAAATLFFSAPRVPALKNFRLLLPARSPPALF